jgi:2-succinyl-6-hydroxy-2,4-cyclohexadiene-1-carboxylate synthase
MPLLQFDRLGAGPPLLWLHGFTQTRASAGEFLSILAGRHELWCADLPGHGRSHDLRASLPDTATLLWESLTGEPATLDVVGYSFGARVALHVALAHADRVRRLVLIAGTAGLANEQAREDRRRLDELRAQRLETVGTIAFLDEWLQLPLFADLDPAKELPTRSADAHGLAASLRLAGTGTQEWLVPRLAALDVPTLLIAGSRDEKFVGEAAILAAALPRAEVQLVDGAAHAPHLSQPGHTAELVNEFLSRP